MRLAAVACILAPVRSSAQPGDTLLTFQQNDVILFQGDHHGWRPPAHRLRFNHIMEQDYAYILAARLGAEYPEKNLTFLDRGVSGDRNVDLAARWKTDALDLKPNLVSPSYCRSAVTSRLTRRVCRREAKTRRREVGRWLPPAGGALPGSFYTSMRSSSP